jgi:hypothetical protein
MTALTGQAGGTSGVTALLSTPRRGPQTTGYVAGPGNTIMGHFVWADPIEGTVANTRTAPWQLLRYLLPVHGDWNRVYFENGFWYLRSGLPATVFAAGNLRMRFAGGAQSGSPVYAALVDGSAISGVALNAELTPWVVTSNCGPWGFAHISTWSTFA